MEREPVTLFEYNQGIRGDLQRKPSRAAIRDRIGSSRIDASAPPSSQDYTPSARNRRALMASAGDPNALKRADAYEESSFNNLFQPRPLSLIQPMGRPSGWGGLSAQPQGLGTPLPGFPPYGVITPQTDQPALTPLSFNLSTPSPLDAATLAPYSPSGGQARSYTPFFRKSAPASYMDTVLNGAAKWLS